MTSLGTQLSLQSSKCKFEGKRKRMTATESTIVKEAAIATAEVSASTLKVTVKLPHKSTRFGHSVDNHAHHFMENSDALT